MNNSLSKKEDKMRNFVALFTVISLLQISVASYSGISQHRLPNENFQHALDRSKESLSHHKKLMLRSKDTPVGKKVPVKEIDYSKVPVIINYQELVHMYQLIRDTRFLYLNENPDFARRISWLYPDDGCFARAALSGMKLTNEQLIRPVKIFAFGNLVVQTPYASAGSVSWWYHVALVLNYMGAYYVLDPALNNQTPLLAEDWFQMMGNADNLKGTVCNAYAYDPFDDCFKATDKSDVKAQKDQLIYLKKEWNRMNYLGFDPKVVLGTNPPWMP